MCILHELHIDLNVNLKAQEQVFVFYNVV